MVTKGEEMVTKGEEIARPEVQIKELESLQEEIQDLKVICVIQVNQILTSLVTPNSLHLEHLLMQR